MTVTGWQVTVSTCKLVGANCQTYRSITSIPLDGERDSKVNDIEGWVAEGYWSRQTWTEEQGCSEANV